MDYKKHYDNLIARAAVRVLESSMYSEEHHIIPKCMGGSNRQSNLVRLLPEEHFVAHQLLTKMYPENQYLVHAAAMMCVANKAVVRSNKLYGWLRRRLAKSLSDSQSGTGNSQYGTCWVTNMATRESKRIHKEELIAYMDSGWINKRVINRWEQHNERVCPECGKMFSGAGKTCSLSCGRIHSPPTPINHFKGKLDLLITEYTNGNSVYRSLVNAGLDGTGQNHVRLNALLKEMKIHRGIAKR